MCIWKPFTYSHIFFETYFAIFVTGVSFEMQQRAIRSGVHILVATPGRALDHISRGTIDLSNVKHVVLDEVRHNSYFVCENYHFGIFILLFDISNFYSAITKLTAIFCTQFIRLCLINNFTSNVITLQYVFRVILC